MVDLYKLSVKFCGNNNKKRQTTYRKKFRFFINMNYMWIFIRLVVNTVFSLKSNLIAIKMCEAIDRCSC